MGVNRDFKKPTEADVLFLVEFVHLLFPQYTFGVRSLLAQKLPERFSMSVFIKHGFYDEVL